MSLFVKPSTRSTERAPNKAIPFPLAIHVSRIFTAALQPSTCTLATPKQTGKGNYPS